MLVNGSDDGMAVVIPVQCCLVMIVALVYSNISTHTYQPATQPQPNLDVERDEGVWVPVTVD